MMNPKILYIGNTEYNYKDTTPSGEYVKIGSEDFYKIQDFNLMKPFFMSIVSDADHWMFLSSNGSLTAGRKNPESALFPYYTVDKIHDSNEITGSKTIVRLSSGQKTFLWEPFSDRYAGIYSISRNIYKNTSGNRVMFEEINHDLHVVFRYSWNNSNRFGFVRKAEIENLSDHNLTIDLLDGFQNIMPYGVNRNMQNDKSPLVDAYKKNELLHDTGIGLYVLSSIPVDRAEPSEALRATSVWSVGEHIVDRLVSSIQMEVFRQGQDVTTETDVRARRGAYFVRIRHELPPLAKHIWYQVAEVCQSSAKIADLKELLRENTDLPAQLEADIQTGTINLTRIVASADGLQVTNDRLTSHRQFANVLFNVMRGGIFDNGYTITKNDFCLFVKNLNIKVYDRHNAFLHSLPTEIHHSELTGLLSKMGDPGLLRAGLEYLPLTFSRRHGDPSRPWNLFSIETRSEDGQKILNYQGNWRDIFQNWEALCLSFPAYVESMISKFVNASTADGYNPYRITRDGFDWEIHDPSDPWSFIGYWGDHQLIYLLKFLELIDKYYPGKLENLLTSEIFSYANVPYHIKSYDMVLKDPHHSITYDETQETLISERVKECGSDGKMIWTKAGEVYYVNLTEKILLSALAKLANFIPEGGIWMNTQRPEWNDANNALVGSGVSMVTMYYLRRYIHFCLRQFQQVSVQEVNLSVEVLNYLITVNAAFEKNCNVLRGSFSDEARKNLLDLLGSAASQYREIIYHKGFSEAKAPVKIENLISFFKVTLNFIDHTIRANHRHDNLFQSYHIMSVNDTGISIAPLGEMLEGQVAVLSSGYLSPTASSAVLDALKKSAMFWPEEYSYLLYPNKQLPRFDEKNVISPEFIKKSALLLRLMAIGDTSIIETDNQGNTHFQGFFTNKQVLGQALNSLDKKTFSEITVNDKTEVQDEFEKLFNHKSFTGRSGTFFGYEGLGCIYWHMVSKLLLAVEELCYQSATEHTDTSVTDKLIKQYYDIRKGLGLNKTPAAYGAFPTDPYSHTPGHHGAQQPGMTGQVKEDILSRFGELGVSVHQGELHFSDLLLRKSEFLSHPATFHYIDVTGQTQELNLDTGSLAFTYCQVPVIYKMSDKEGITMIRNTISKQQDGLNLDKTVSRALFQRDGSITSIEVRFKK